MRRRRLLNLFLIILLVFLGNKIAFAREFPVESDLSGVEIKKITAGEKKTFTSPISIDQLTADWKEKTSYELFWPIVAGKVPGDRFYGLKIWRDKVLASLYFSPLKKSEYFKQLANKRLLEAEKLLEIGRTSYFSQTLQQSLEYLEKGLNLLSSAPEGQSQLWLKGEYEKDLQKHLVVLGRMKEKAGENQKAVVEESIKKINNLIK